MISLVDRKYIRNIFYALYLSITLYISLYIIIMKMPDLLPVEKSILEPLINNLKVILANYEELSFIDFQLLLSSTTKPLSFTKTATILNILQRHQAISLVSERRPKHYIINKKRMSELIESLGGESERNTR